MELEVNTITTSGYAFTLIMAILILSLPRRYALVPLMISGCYMTLGQILLIGPLHFSILRILIFFGWIRIFLKGEIKTIKLTAIDKVLIAWVISSFILYIILREGSSEAFIARLGFFYNTVGIYFFIRAIVRDLNDIVQVVKILSVIIIPIAVLFVVEMTTGRNLFSAFGGVPEISAIRYGRIRCQGPFRNSILGGTFGATALPLFVGLWFYNERNRRLAAFAIVAATIIVISSSSSGPLIAYIAGTFGLILWVYRAKMKYIQLGAVILLLVLHMVMKAPVWFLIDRVSGLIGGGGWHRSAIIDAAIHHFNEWWLMGTTYTAHWMATGLAIDPNNTDITNQFIAEGIRGGLISVVLFIWLITRCFKAVGLASRNEDRFSQSERIMMWSIGCALLGHVTSFFSVSYFDQIIIFWYLVIAMTATLLELNPSVSDNSEGAVTQNL
jgi:hypothetical protein